MVNFQPQAYKVLPEVIKNLLIINGIMFLASWALRNTTGIELTQYLGMYQPGSSEFSPWQIVTNVFMHGSFMHLFFNMFALWMFGSAIENIWGTKRFLTYYLVTAIGASLVWAGVNLIEILYIKSQLTAAGVPVELLEGLRRAVSPEIANDLVNSVGMPMDMDQIVKYYLIYHTPVVGASGAVFGILLAFGMMFPESKIYLYFAIPIKAKWFVIGYGALELFSGISGYQSGVAHFAHLGGMIIGYFMILYYRKRRFRH